MILKMTPGLPIFSSQEVDWIRCSAYEDGLFTNPIFKFPESIIAKIRCKGHRKSLTREPFPHDRIRANQRNISYSRVESCGSTSTVCLSLCPFLNRSVYCSYLVPVAPFHIGCGRGR